MACASEIAAKPPIAIWGSKQALQFAREAQRYREQGKAYQQILIDYPKESARLKESLHNYQPQPRPPLSSLKEETLRQAISLSSNRQINLRKERQAVTDSLNQLESTGQEYHVRVDELRKQLLQQTKVASSDKIRELISLQLPGIPLLPLPVAPTPSRLSAPTVPRLPTRTSSPLSRRCPPPPAQSQETTSSPSSGAGSPEPLPPPSASQR